MSWDPWRSYRNSLDSYEHSLARLSYPSALAPTLPGSHSNDLESMLREALGSRPPEGAIRAGAEKTLLHAAAIAPPHGYALLDPVPIPEFPEVPLQPSAAD